MVLFSFQRPIPGLLAVALWLGGCASSDTTPDENCGCPDDTECVNAVCVPIGDRPDARTLGPDLGAGGAPVGGMPIAGAPMGGAPAGGAGGVPTGGMPTGGMPTGGAPTGGAGGQQVGGAGGAPMGGAPMGGAPMGGEPNPMPDLGVPDAEPSPAPDMRVPDAEVPDMAPPGECGAYGQPCCLGAEPCAAGGCVNDVCVAFGGAYAIDSYDSPGECTVGNPFNNNLCSCPPGFRDQLLEDADFDADEGAGLSHRIYTCGPRLDIPGADYRGAFGEAIELDNRGCVETCNTNLFTGACTCPGGAILQTLPSVHYQQNPDPDCGRALGLCFSPVEDAADNLTYGGAYRVQSDRGRTCMEVPPAARCEPNPITRTCGCPEGFQGLAMGAMAPHTDPARGPLWYCRADLTICYRMP